MIATVHAIKIDINFSKLGDILLQSTTDIFNRLNCHGMATAPYRRRNASGGAACQCGAIRVQYSLSKLYLYSTMSDTCSLAIIGDGAVGKSSIIAAFKSDGFMPVYKQVIIK